MILAPSAASSLSFFFRPAVMLSSDKLLSYKKLNERKVFLDVECQWILLCDNYFQQSEKLPKVYYVRISHTNTTCVLERKGFPWSLTVAITDPIADSLLLREARLLPLALPLPLVLLRLARHLASTFSATRDNVQVECRKGCEFVRMLLHMSRVMCTVKYRPAGGKVRFGLSGASNSPMFSSSSSSNSPLYSSACRHRLQLPAVTWKQPPGDSLGCYNATTMGLCNSWRASEYTLALFASKTTINSYIK